LLSIQCLGAFKRFKCFLGPRVYRDITNEVQESRKPNFLESNHNHIHGFGTNVSGVEDTNIPYWSKNSALGIVKQRIELIHLD